MKKVAKRAMRVPHVSGRKRAAGFWVGGILLALALGAAVRWPAAKALEEPRAEAMKAPAVAEDEALGVDEQPAAPLQDECGKSSNPSNSAEAAPEQQPEIVYAGYEEEPEVQPQRPQERQPTGIAYKHMAEKLAHLFTTITEPPPDEGFDKHFQEYTENLSTKIQLEGERENLTVVRLMFYDRRTMSPRSEREQNDIIKEFVAAAGGTELVSDVIAFAAQAGEKNGAPVEEKNFPLGVNELHVTIQRHYGSGFVEVRTAEPRDGEQPAALP